MRIAIEVGSSLLVGCYAALTLLLALVAFGAVNSCRTLRQTFRVRWAIYRAYAVATGYELVFRSRKALRREEAFLVPLGGDPTGAIRGMVIVVPGTWRKSAWSRWAPLATDLNEAGLKVVGCQWSASNDELARRVEATRLANEISRLRSQYRFIALVGHSHGGQVAVDASRSCKVDIVITLATPFFAVWPRTQKQTAILALGIALRALLLFFAGAALIYLTIFSGSNIAFTDAVIPLAAGIAAVWAMKFIFFTEPGLWSNPKDAVRVVQSTVSPVLCVNAAADELIELLSSQQTEMFASEVEAAKAVSRFPNWKRRLGYLFGEVMLFGALICFASLEARGHFAAIQSFWNWMHSLPDIVETAIASAIIITAWLAINRALARFRGRGSPLATLRRLSRFVSMPAFLNASRANAIGELCGVPFWSRFNIGVHTQEFPPGARTLAVEVPLTRIQRLTQWIPWRHTRIVETRAAHDAVAAEIIGAVHFINS